jgi:hypothetical protein
MTVTRYAIFAAALLAAGASAIPAGDAEARGAKEYFVQTYTFDKPMHGYSGRAGNHYCDYQRLPERKCTLDRAGNEKCAIVAWTLRQHCY